jgi:hypothetical protein
MMVIDTPEKARNLEKAFRDAEKRGPLKFEGPSFDEIIREGEEFFKNNPNWLKEAGRKGQDLGGAERSGDRRPDG